MIAYASAYLKCRYLAAFTAALLNNQPMGFYSPATIVKDAQRHGLKLLPVDVTCSEWKCTLEEAVSSQLSASKNQVVGRSSLVVSQNQGSNLKSNDQRLPTNDQSPIALRMGLRYVRGLREEAAQALVRERMLGPFESIHDLTRRVPELRKDELLRWRKSGR